MIHLSNQLTARLDHHQLPPTCMDYMCVVHPLPVFGVRKNGFAQRWQLLQEVWAVSFHRSARPYVCSGPAAHVLTGASSRTSSARCPRRVTPSITASPDTDSRRCCRTSSTPYVCTSRAASWRATPTSGPMPRAFTHTQLADGSPVYLAAEMVLALAPYHVRLWQCVRAYWDTGRPAYVKNSAKYCRRSP